MWQSEIQSHQLYRSSEDTSMELSLQIISFLREHDIYTNYMQWREEKNRSEGDIDTLLDLIFFLTQVDIYTDFLRWKLLQRRERENEAVLRESHNSDVPTESESEETSSSDDF
jgi:hypothetical protein